MYRTIIILLFLIVQSFCSAAKRQIRTFDLDESLHTVTPLCFQGFRVISPEYRIGSTPYYFIGKNEGAYPDQSLASMIEGLLTSNACISCATADTLSISIHEFKFYDQPVNGEVMSLFLRADFFIGKKDELHHIYSLDTFFQQRQHANGSAKFVAASILQGASTACLHQNVASAVSLTDEQADQFHEAERRKYPLYTSANPPVSLFRTVDDFIHLRPTETEVVFEHIPSMDGDGYNYFYKKKPDGSKGSRISGKDFYAGCDGKNFWLSTGTGFHKIEKREGELYFKISGKMLVSLSSDYGAYGLSGLLLGMAIDEAQGGSKGHKERREVTGRFSPVKKRFVPSSDKGPLPR